MARSQRIVQKQAATKPTIQDNRQPRKLNESTIDLSTANAPVRTVLFVEIGDMDQKRLQLLLQSLGESYDPAKNGITYFIPVRKGKISSDILFEGEIERLSELFDIVDNSDNIIEGAKLKLKDGAKDVMIIRQHV